MRSPGWLTNRPFAHRGLHSGSAVPENSLLAFKRAVGRGYGIELDVQHLADGEVAVFHDDELERMTGRSGFISEETCESVSKLELLGTGERIPLLRQVLESVGARVPILVELKTHRPPGEFESEVARIMRAYGGEFAVQSFNHSTVEWFKLSCPEFIRGLNCDDIKTVHPTRIAECQPDYIACELAGLPESKHELPIVVWTVQTDGERRSSSAVSDNFIFEDFLP